MKAWFTSLLVGVLMAALPAIAHHSFSAEYDETKPVKVAGVVTRVEWQNPHIWFYVDSKDDAGNVTHWAFSGGAPGQLMRRGIVRDVIQPGMTVNVEGFRAKDGSNTVNARSITLADGKQVFAGSSDDGGPDSGESKGRLN